MVDTGDENTICDLYCVGGVNYHVYFDLSYRRQQSIVNGNFKEQQPYSLDDLIDKSPYQINSSNAWEIISRLDWKLLSESMLKHRDVRRKIDRVGASILKKAFMIYTSALVERFPDIDYLVAVQLIALGKNHYDMVLDSPDYLVFIQTELQPIDLHIILDIP